MNYDITYATRLDSRCFYKGTFSFHMDNEKLNSENNQTFKVRLDKLVQNKKANVLIILIVFVCLIILLAESKQLL